MTNFRYMKEKALDTVASLDEAELRRLTIDTCMEECDAEGIFNCGLCEEVYGDCDTLPEGNGCMKKYLDWCAQEHKDTAEPAGEDKKLILSRLEMLLEATRMGSGIKALTLSGDGNRVIIQFTQGSRTANVECDSGYAMIMDVLRAL